MPRSLTGTSLQRVAVAYTYLSLSIMPLPFSALNPATYNSPVPILTLFIHFPSTLLVGYPSISLPLMLFTNSFSSYVQTISTYHTLPIQQLHNPLPPVSHLY